MRPGRLLILCPGVPHASKGASLVLFYHYTAALKQAGFTILNLLLLDPEADDAADLAAYREQMAGENFQIEVCRAGPLVRRTWGGFELVESSVQPAVAAARVFAPQTIFCLDLTCAWLARLVPGVARVVWLGDLNFQTTWHHAVCKAKEDPRALLRLPSAWKKARQWRRGYARVLAGAAQVIVSSHSSVQAMRELGIASVYYPYPWPASSTPAAVALPADGVPTFLFCGTLNALGSKSALLFLLQKLYPQLTALWGEGRFRLFIAGRGKPPAWTQQAMAKKPEIQFLGFVGDLDALMARCHAMIVPIDIPVGNRSRIITAMAGGCPVVAHRFVSETNPALVDGATCLLADDAPSFAAQMRVAVEQPARMAEIITRARQCYLDNFAPGPACRLLLVELDRVLAAAAINRVDTAPKNP